MLLTQVGEKLDLIIVGNRGLCPLDSNTSLSQLGNKTFLANPDGSGKLCNRNF